METEFGIAIIAMLPGLLAPLIAWFLSQRGMSRRAKVLESLLTRMELVEKLRQFQKHPSDGKTRLVESLDNEVHDILDDLDSLRETQAPLATSPRQQMADWKQLFLLYKQASLKGRVYKVLFYVSSVITIFGTAVFIPRSLIDQGMTPSFWVSLLITVAFYLVIALVFRAAAIRDYDRMTMRSMAARTDRQSQR